MQPSEREKRQREPPPPLDVEILRDRGNAVARRYGLVYTLPGELQEVYRRLGIDLSVINGDGEWALPMAARIVIDPYGTVRRIDTDPDYRQRPEPLETVDFLHRLIRERTEVGERAGPRG